MFSLHDQCLVGCYRLRAEDDDRGEYAILEQAVVDGWSGRRAVDNTVDHVGKAKRGSRIHDSDSGVRKRSPKRVGSLVDAARAIEYMGVKPSSDLSQSGDGGVPKHFNEIGVLGRKEFPIGGGPRCSPR